MAPVRPAVSLLGTSPRAVALGRAVNLHYRERLCRIGRGRRGRPGVRLRPGHVPARLPHAAPACDCRRRTGDWLLPVELTGQLRVDLRLREPIWADLRGLQDAEAHAEAQRRLVR